MLRLPDFPDGLTFLWQFHVSDYAQQVSGQNQTTELIVKNDVQTSPSPQVQNICSVFVLPFKTSMRYFSSFRVLCFLFAFLCAIVIHREADYIWKDVSMWQVVHRNTFAPNKVIYFVQLLSLIIIQYINMKKIGECNVSIEKKYSSGQLHWPEAGQQSLSPGAL